MTPEALMPAAFAMLIAWGLYRRFRRLFGRQPVQPTRMKVRIAVLLLVGALLTLRGIRQPDLALAIAAGCVGGVALAFLGLKLTQFESTPQGRFYTPHGGIGLALSVLLIGRLAYRFFVLYPGLHAAQSGDANAFAGFQRSPLTTALFGLLVGYYVVYFAGVLIKSGAPAAARLDGQA